MTPQNQIPAIHANSMRPPLARLPFYYGWVIVFVAALMMLATLPGRTQGLGLVTEPLLTDLNLSRSAYAQMNLWATLLGSLFCLPVGRWIDRYGARPILVLIILGLGTVVWGISQVTSAATLFGLILLTRGLGQSALSVASIALVGKWFQRRISLAMGVYSVLVGIMFAIAFGLVGLAVREQGWRTAWQEIAIALLCGFAPIAWLLARSTPESCGVVADAAERDTTALQGVSLAAALRTPAFWVFASATAMYGLVISGVGLFNEAILQELGFDRKTYHTTLVITTLVGLASQFVSGWLGSKWPLKRLMAVAMALYACSLMWLPQVAGRAELYANAVLMGTAGGMIIVVFFAIWPDWFGRRHLGMIQGAAQMLTVLSSAVGPLVFAECYARTASYSPAFYALAPMVLILGVASWCLSEPARGTKSDPVSAS